MKTRIVLGAISSAAALLLATSAHAVQLHFEAWPTFSNEGCPPPCYEMRMFLQVDPSDPQNIQAIQMDIRIGEGAVPAQLPVFPDGYGRAGPGNVHTHSVGNQDVRVPWDLTSTVVTSPLADFDALMVHAADVPFTVDGLADLVEDPGTTCTNAARCDFVEDALALNRAYLGFIAVTRSTTPTGLNPSAHGGAPFNYEPWPRGVPFFEIYVGNIYGNGDAVEALGRNGGGTGFIQFMPEPSPVLLLAGVLVMVATYRRSR